MLFHMASHPGKTGLLLINLGTSLPRYLGVVLTADVNSFISGEGHLGVIGCAHFGNRTLQAVGVYISVIPGPDRR